MRKIAVSFTLATALLLGACGNDKKESAEPAPAPEQPKADETAENKDVVKADAKGTVEEGGFIKYRSAEWSGEHNGLNIHVNSVSVIPTISEVSNIEEIADKSGLMVWLTLENTTDKPIKFDMPGTKLTTDDGYEVDNSGYLNTEMIDVIKPGTKREGDVGFLLSSETDARAVSEITLSLPVEKPDEESMYDTVDAKIKLK